MCVYFCLPGFGTVSGPTESGRDPDPGPESAYEMRKRMHYLATRGVLVHGGGTRHREPVQVRHPGKPDKPITKMINGN